MKQFIASSLLLSQQQYDVTNLECLFCVYFDESG